jgi:hypothetical protein
MYECIRLLFRMPTSPTAPTDGQTSSSRFFWTRSPGQLLASAESRRQLSHRRILQRIQCIQRIGLQCRSQFKTLRRRKSDLLKESFSKSLFRRIPRHLSVVQLLSSAAPVYCETDKLILYVVHKAAEEKAHGASSGAFHKWEEDREYELITEAHTQLFVVGNCSRFSLPVYCLPSPSSPTPCYC